jgi:type II secretory pathway pseudopilin PulG
MTIFEAALLAAVVGIALFVVTGGVRLVREQARDNLARRLVAQLDAALAAYYAAAGAYPPGAPDGSAGPAIAALERVSDSANQLNELPQSLRERVPPQDGCVDPWRRPLRYLTATSANPQDAAEVAANGGVPIFESAGRDGDFGLVDRSAAIDNLRTSDLR